MNLVNLKKLTVTGKTVVTALVCIAALGVSAAQAQTCNGYVGITFDDGPTGDTGTLVNLLNQNNLKPVTWFNIGQNVAGNPGALAGERSVGEVQNHSYTHQHMAGWSVAQSQDELNRTNQNIQNAGSPKPTIFRPPYGETSSNLSQAASNVGLRVVTWNVDSQDWNGASTSAIVNANNQLQNGQVILMHDGIANTRNAIAQIASNLRSRGLCPGRIDPATGRAVAPAGGSSSSSSSSSSTSSTSSSSSSSSSGGTGTTKNITVRARGTAGGESITLSVNNNNIATWTLSTGMQDYSAQTNQSGGINVAFTNDGTNRDVQVDYIIVNGQTRQSEAQTTNTGLYANGRCGGGSNSEWMHCNGYIGYGNTP